MTRKQKRMLIRILIAAVLFLAALITDHTLHPSMWIVLPIFAAAYLVVGWDILWKAIRNISHGQIFDENFLMAIASLGAFAMQEFDESVAVMLLYQIGELFQSYAVNKSRNAISSLVELRHQSACRCPTPYIPKGNHGRCCSRPRKSIRKMAWSTC